MQLRSFSDKVETFAEIILNTKNLPIINDNIGKQTGHNRQRMKANVIEI